MKATDRTSGKVLAPNLAVADTFFTRLKGLLGKQELPHGEGLWIKPCNSVHTFGMKFPIDIIFLDKNYRIIGLANGLNPNRASKVLLEASSVIELPAGTLVASKTVVGNVVEIV
jgi:uncharacterized membrane protein (UPF0127 family)